MISILLLAAGMNSGAPLAPAANMRPETTVVDYGPFLKAHPNREIFSLDQIRFRPLADPAPLEALSGDHSIAAVAKRLTMLGIKYERVVVSLDTETVPLAILEQIDQLPKTEPFIIPQPGLITASVITSRKVVGPDAAGMWKFVEERNSTTNGKLIAAVLQSTDRSTALMVKCDLDPDRIISFQYATIPSLPETTDVENFVVHTNDGEKSPLIPLHWNSTKTGAHIADGEAGRDASRLAEWLAATKGVITFEAKTSSGSNLITNYMNNGDASAITRVLKACPKGELQEPSL